LESRTLLAVCTVDFPGDTNTGFGDHGDLRYCLNRTNDFWPGQADNIDITITGDINLRSPLPELLDDVTIDGPGANQVTVQRNSATPFRIFTIAPDVTVSIRDLSVKNGMHHRGGGIYNAGNLTITNSVIRQNFAAWDHPQGFFLGAGIYNADKADLRIERSTITRNALCPAANCTTPIPLVGWVSFYGGGIYNEGNLEVLDSTISANTVEAPDPGPASYRAEGAGIYTITDDDPTAVLTIANSTISGNSVIVYGATAESQLAGALGGGVSAYYTDALISNSTFSGNTVDNRVLADCQMCKQPQSAGGAIFVKAATWQIGSTTITKNKLLASDPQAQIEGSGMYIFPFAGELEAIVHLRNTIVAGNTGADDIFGPLASSDNNFIGGDPMLADLAFSGGPTQTHALLPGSPALNAGNSTGATEWDQRGPGFDRTVNRIDIGAFECQPGECGSPPPPLPAVFRSPAHHAPRQETVNIGDQRPILHFAPVESASDSADAPVNRPGRLLVATIDALWPPLDADVPNTPL
jgi:hypothetical protein